MSDQRGVVRRIKIAYGRQNRQRKVQFATEFARGRDVQTVLLVGVSGGWATGKTPEERVLMQTENIVERGLLDAGLKITASGLEETAAGWDDYVSADALDLPFADKSYDLVYSNAVIEHVGGEDEQRQFVAEHRRVGKHWVFTTPNRWFPVESHSDVLFRHWRDSWVEQSPLVTRLLGPPDVRRLVGSQGIVHGRRWSPTLTATSK